MAPSGIEAATFRFVAQRLNHCATAVPTRDLYVTDSRHWLTFLPYAKSPHLAETMNSRWLLENECVRKVSIPRTLRTDDVIVAIQFSYSEKKHTIPWWYCTAPCSLRPHFPVCPSILLNVQNYSPQRNSVTSRKTYLQQYRCWVPQTPQRLETCRSYLKILWKYIPKHFQYCRHCVKKRVNLHYAARSPDPKHWGQAHSPSSSEALT